MNVKYITKRLDTLSEHTIYNQLYALTNPGMLSHMKALLNAAKDDKKMLSDMAAIIASKHGEYVAWSLVITSRSQMMFFVRRHYRRYGIGSALCEHGIRYLKRHTDSNRAWVSAWDDLSTNFFESLGFECSSNGSLFSYSKRI